ncbi:hypothetical protein [Opitutus terrae]|uniref:hypothetical protein n=1 Tax=Opitutus terrae TaxID=107709 RepID=UPI00031EA102|nr:hypothetical protein [Opitutus terrae]
MIGDDNNLHLGLRRAAGEAKPALQVLAELADLFSGDYRAAKRPARQAAGDPPAGSDGVQWLERMRDVVFRLRGARMRWGVWTL